MEKSGIWQFHLLGLVSMYLHAKNYQNILRGLKVIVIYYIQSNEI